MGKCLCGIYIDFRVIALNNTWGEFEDVSINNAGFDREARNEGTLVALGCWSRQVFY